MEDIIVQKFGPACGKHGSCTFYKAFKYTKNGKSKIIALGQFFFMKILKGIPICLGELQLVWEDNNSGQDLASLRLYFLPECTPDGRQANHGEDEVLAYSEKIVLKLDDIASLITQNVTWSEGRRAFTTDKILPHPEFSGLAEAFKGNCYGLSTNDVEKAKDSLEDKENDCDDISPEVAIMTYPKYCRYRCVLKRLENCADKWMRNAIVCALGGFSSKKENNRVYFCRDTFDDSNLDDLEMRCDHLAPNLKGRPRKRKGSKQGNESSEESSCSSSMSSQQESVVNKIRTGARDTPLRNGFRVDKMTKVSKDEQAFLIDLHKFMKSRNTPIGRIPSLGFKQIDLYQFYSLAEEIGGYEQITAKRMWKNIYDTLGGNPGSTSAATYTRRHYEKCHLAHIKEQWQKNNKRGSSVNGVLTIEFAATLQFRVRRLLLPYERYKMGYLRPAHLKKKKFRVELGTFKKSPDEKTAHQDKKEEVNMKIEIKEEPKVRKNDPQEVANGSKVIHTGYKSVDLDNRALIIKQEIAKMKMRKVKEEPKMRLSDPHVVVNGNKVKRVDLDNRALIIKQEIAKMKMRKDAQRHVDKEKITDREKLWEDSRKYKWGDKRHVDKEKITEKLWEDRRKYKWGDKDAQRHVDKEKITEKLWEDRRKYKWGDKDAQRHVDKEKITEKLWEDRRKYKWGDKRHVDKEKITEKLWEDRRKYKWGDKDAQRHVDKEKITEKLWEDRRKYKWGDKVRKPSGGQKTVRELLDENGKDVSDIGYDKLTENMDEQKTERGGVRSSERSGSESNINSEKARMDHHTHKVPDTKQQQTMPGTVTVTHTDPRMHQQTLLSPMIQPRPMFYPQLIPVGEAIRGVTPMAMPFMIPQFGIQTVANPMQVMQSIANPISKESKPLLALNKLVTEQKDIRHIPSSIDDSAIIIPNRSNYNRVSNFSPPCAPPSNHVQPPKGPLTSPQANASYQRPITPAHSNGLKRQYPYMESNRNLPTYGANFPENPIKRESTNSDTHAKRQRALGSPSNDGFKSNSEQLDVPVLDLSMKTLRAQEARQQRGESLLFNTSFNKENKGVVKPELCEGPQDLSIRSAVPKFSAHTISDLTANSSTASIVQRNVPLNIPKPQMEQRIPTGSRSNNADFPRRAMDPKKEKPELPTFMPYKNEPNGMGAGMMPSINGLPIDFGAFVHPAFPQQMLMQGIFPTPLQLQQMIQGQVAAGLPLLHPEFISSPMMFTPTFSSVPPTMFSTVSPTMARTSSSTANSSLNNR